MTHASTILTKAAIAAVVALALCPVTTLASEPDSVSNLLPERAIVLTGDPSAVHQNVVAALYYNKEFQFHDPSAPRFLLLDRKGKIAFGIGGYVYGTMSYDFDGAIDHVKFMPNLVPVPFNPAQRSGMQFDASHSTVFFQLAGHSEKFGTYMAYIQTEFSGGSNGSHDLMLKQAYVKVGNVTAGLAQSGFVDPVGPPDLDTQGSCAGFYKKSVLLRYAKPFGKHWTLAVGAESPTASTYTVRENQEKAITQRVPDFPVYLQYNWGSDSHVRLSGIVRTLSYRDLVAQRNCYATGWGVQLTGSTAIPGNLTFFYQTYYGKGLGTFINDLSGKGFDLIPCATKVGHMKAPGNFGYVVALKWDFCKRGFATAIYGQTRLYDQGHLGADTYRRSMMVEANVMYTLFDDFQLGIEYLYGNRYNMNLEHGRANRIMAAVKYSF